LKNLLIILYQFLSIACTGAHHTYLVLFTVSEINVDFSRKSQNFPIPRVFCTPADGVPLGIGYRRTEHGVKN